MSEGIIIALISMTGAVIGAAISAFGSIAAVERKTESSKMGCGLLGLIASVGALGGLILGAVFAVLLTQFTGPTMGHAPQPTMNIVSTTIPETGIPETDVSVIGAQFCPPTGSSNAVFSGDLAAFGNEIPSVGTGVFSSVVRPFGTKPSKYTYVKDALDNLCVQLISPGFLLDRSSDRQCKVSDYTTNRFWVGSVLAGTSIHVKKTGSLEFIEIGRIDLPASDARSYVVEYNLGVGDEICIVAPTGTSMGELVNRGGYHMFWGRDLQVLTDSWCILLENDSSRHYCN
jgi:hypothetical protein